jgi:hypothetical protein
MREWHGRDEAWQGGVGVVAHQQSSRSTSSLLSVTSPTERRAVWVVVCEKREPGRSGPFIRPALPMSRPATNPTGKKTRRAFNNAVYIHAANARPVLYAT